MIRLLVAISAHGLGHLGQAAPVCNALRTLRPDLDWTIWSALPTTTIAARITGTFQHIAQPCDLGLVMHDAMRVDVAASWRRYAARDADWPAALAAACALVSAVKPDLILSDVGDMPLAAAQQLNIPAIAMSSLNWADMAEFYFADTPDSAPLLNRLTAIYDHVPCALRLSPGMPMRGQEETILPPVAAISNHSRSQLSALIMPLMPNALAHRPRVLISMGGIETELPLIDWPEQSALTLMVANQTRLPNEGLPAQGIVNAEYLRTRTGLGFADLLAASDAVVCKPGYGTFVEAALAGTPVLYVVREDWPEQQVLVDWLQANARCAQLAPERLSCGELNEAVTQLLKQPAKPVIRQDGALVAAKEILRYLNR